MPASGEFEQMGICPLISRFDGVNVNLCSFKCARIWASSQRKRVPASDTHESHEIRSCRTQRAIQQETARALRQRQIQLPRLSSPWAPSMRFCATTPLSLVMVTSVDILWIEVLKDQLLRKEQLQLMQPWHEPFAAPMSVLLTSGSDWPPLVRPH